MTVLTAPARVLLVAGAIALGGCLEFEAPIDATPTRDLDPALMGTWRCLPMNAAPDEKPANFVIGQARPRVYSIRFEAPGDDWGHYEAHPSLVNGRTVLNVRDLEPKAGDKPWAFARYAFLRPNVLYTELVDEDALKGVPRTPAALRAALEQRDKQDGLYADVCVCVRAKPDGATPAAGSVAPTDSASAGRRVRRAGPVELPERARYPIRGRHADGR